MNWLQFGVTLLTTELPLVIKNPASRQQLLNILLPLQLSISQAIAELQTPAAPPAAPTASGSLSTAQN